MFWSWTDAEISQLCQCTNPSNFSSKGGCLACQFEIRMTLFQAILPQGSLGLSELSLNPLYDSRKFL